MTTKNNILDKAQKLIFIDTEPSTSDLTLLETVVDLTYDKVLKRIQAKILSREEMPLELTTTVTELSIIRYNRIGSEGLTSESVEGHSASYSEKEEQALWQDVYDWIDLNGSQEPFVGRIRFL